MSVDLIAGLTIGLAVGVVSILFMAWLMEG